MVGWKIFWSLINTILICSLGWIVNQFQSYTLRGRKNECQHLFLGRHWGWCFCIFKIQNFKRYAINHRSVNCQQNFLFQRFSYLTLPSVWTFSYFFIVSYFSLYIVSYFIVTVGATPLFPPPIEIHGDRISISLPSGAGIAVLQQLWVFSERVWDLFGVFSIAL